jgi:hypothetical protein
VRVSARTKSIATVIAGALVLMYAQAALGADCRPPRLKPLYFLKTMGPCKFDIDTLSFEGPPADQAMCLMRGMDVTRNLGPTLQSLPEALASRVGQTTGLPSREVLSEYLSKAGLEYSFAAYLWQPLSHAEDNNPDAPVARYFVIHDTSGPNYGHRAFPDDVNSNPKINNLQNFVCSDEWGKAHVVLSRTGSVLLDHELSTPWRETKFEQAAEFGGELKGLFLHVEMIQPRRAGAHGGDSRSPDPAFSPMQYDRLALIYTIASVRGGRWLIPAFHAALDADIFNGHDDPLNFSVESFADSIGKLAKTLSGAPEVQASIEAPITDATSNNATTEGTMPDGEQKQADNAAPQSHGVDPLDSYSAIAVHTVAAIPPSKTDTASKVASTETVPAPPAHESSDDRKSTRDEHCTTHRVRGHLRRSCGSDVSEHRGRRRLVRSADRDDSDDGGGRRHKGHGHTHHARGSS